MKLFRIVVYAAIVVAALLLMWQLWGRGHFADKQKELPYVSDFTPEEIIEWDESESASLNGKPFQAPSGIIDRRGDTIDLNSIIEDGRVLVTRFSSKSCTSCVNHVVDALMRYRNVDSTTRIVLLIADVPVRELHVIEHDLNRKFQIYKADSLTSDFEEALIPYFLRPDSAGNIAHHFIPRKEIPQRIYEYLLDRP